MSYFYSYSRNNANVLEGRNDWAFENESWYGRVSAINGTAIRWCWWWRWFNLRTVQLRTLPLVPLPTGPHPARGDSGVCICIHVCLVWSVFPTAFLVTHHLQVCRQLQTGSQAQLDSIWTWRNARMRSESSSPTGGRTRAARLEVQCSTDWATPSSKQLSYYTLVPGEVAPSGSIPRNTCVACEHSFAWLPRKCVCRTDRRRTKWSLCAAMLCRRQKSRILLNCFYRKQPKHCTII